ncbi:MAG: hypothetical protein IT444_07655 [Phycisphaeraceae bacterium]|nr:hypothetical protein [Phycisphaeraceae bacterium]
MTWAVFQSVWIVLAVLVYLLFTSVLYVIAMYHHRQISIHDTLRESKTLRQQYLKAIRSKQEA